MEKIFINKFQTISFAKENKLMVFAWLPLDKNYLNDTLLINEIIIGAELIKKHLPKRIIVQTENLKYLINPDIQKDINKILYDAYKIANVKKLAFIVSENIITQMSIEQTVSESKFINFFETKYFKNIESAMNWISL